MSGRSLTSDSTTAIQALLPIDETAITVAVGDQRPQPTPVEVCLKNIVLAEAGTTRRAGRWLYIINYVNLGLSLVLWLALLEVTSAMPWPVGEVALTAWLILDFAPVALVFAGAQRLKHVKGLFLAWGGAGATVYLTIQRAALAALLTLVSPTLVSIPLEPVALACVVTAGLNAISALRALRLLAQPGLRRAFR
jgi:hypothetical protein